MLATREIPGMPNWLDLGTPDTGAAASFYADLLGWQFEPAGSRAGGYGFFTLEGRTVAAMGPLAEEGAPSAWTPYFHSRDADSTAKTVEQAGGTVRVAPMDVFDRGRMAQFTDPGGCRFAVWQPRATRGLDAVNAPGTLCWTELHTSEPAVARAFYDSVFGWTYQDVSMGSFTYTMLSPCEDGPDDTFGGMMPLSAGETPRWLAYVEVADCDAVVARVQELGGSVVVPAETAENIGRMARLADPFGAIFAVITSAAS